MFKRHAFGRCHGVTPFSDVLLQGPSNWESREYQSDCRFFNRNKRRRLFIRPWVYDIMALDLFNERMARAGECPPPKLWLAVSQLGKGMHSIMPCARGNFPWVTVHPSDGYPVVRHTDDAEAFALLEKLEIKPFYLSADEDWSKHNIFVAELMLQQFRAEHPDENWVR